MRNDPISRLAAANPVPHSGPLNLPEPVRLRSRKSLGVIAIALVALASTGVAITATLGAFPGIRAASHPQTGKDALPSKLVGDLQRGCSSGSYEPSCHLVLSTSRLVDQLPDGSKLYVVRDTRRELCIVGVDLSVLCRVSLSRSIPLSEEDEGSREAGWIVYGIALNGVTAVSFDEQGREVTVPVKDNTWVYEVPAGVKTLPGHLTAHFADGTSVRE